MIKSSVIDEKGDVGIRAGRIFWVEKTEWKGDLWSSIEDRHTCFQTCEVLLFWVSLPEFYQA